MEYEVLSRNYSLRIKMSSFSDKKDAGTTRNFNRCQIYTYNKIVFTLSIESPYCPFSVKQQHLIAELML